MNLKRGRLDILQDTAKLCLGGFQLEFVSVSLHLINLVENLFFKNPLQDLLSSLNAVNSTNESTRIITDHVIYNLAYTYKFQLKTTLM